MVDEAERLRTALAAFSLSPARNHGMAEDLALLLDEVAAAVDEGRAPRHLHAWDRLAATAADERLRTRRLCATIKSPPDMGQ